MLQQRINEYFDDPAIEQALVEAVCRLSRIRSVRGQALPGKPYGEGPAAALEEGLALCRELGFQTRNYDGYVGLADCNGQDTVLHILAHLDVVSEGAGWTVTQPYEPKVADGLLYGRGVADDKGPAVAALFAMKAARELGGPLKSNVRLILGTDEESGSSDIAYYYAREPFAPYSFSPDADFPIINIEKGHYKPEFGAAWAPQAALPGITGLQGGIRANVVPPEAKAQVAGLDRAGLEPVCRKLEEETGCAFTLDEIAGGVEIHAAGRAAHAAGPQEGNNALTALLALLARLPLAESPAAKAVRSMHALFPHGDTAGKGLGIAQSDPESGALTMNLALMTLDDKGFQAKIDVRYPLCADEDNCKGAAERSFAAHGITVTGAADMAPPHHVAADSPLVQTLLRCYEQYTGVKDAKPLAIGGGTYVHDIPGGVAFGPNFPGFDTKMHGPDERISVKDLLTACKIFTQAILELCG